MNISDSEAKLNQQIKQAEARNKYLKNNIELMKQALEEGQPNNKSSVHEKPDANAVILKQIQTVEKNIAIAQRELTKVKSTALSLDELMSESLKLQKAIKEKGQEKKTLVADIAKIKKEMYIKHRDIEDPQGSARIKVESYDNQVKVLKKKLSLLQMTSKPNLSALLTQSPPPPKQQPQPKKQDQSFYTKMLRQELAVYTNLCHSYKKKLQTLTTEVAALQVKQRQKQSETDAVDKEIEEWMAKVEELKKGLPSSSPSKFRKGLTEKKLVKLI